MAFLLRRNEIVFDDFALVIDTYHGADDQDVFDLVEQGIERVFIMDMLQAKADFFEALRDIVNECWDFLLGRRHWHIWRWRIERRHELVDPVFGWKVPGLRFIRILLPFLGVVFGRRNKIIQVVLSMRLAGGEKDDSKTPRQQAWPEQAKTFTALSLVLPRVAAVAVSQRYSAGLLVRLRRC